MGDAGGGDTRAVCASEANGEPAQHTLSHVTFTRLGLDLCGGQCGAHRLQLCHLHQCVAHALLGIGTCKVAAVSKSITELLQAQQCTIVPI